MGASWRRVAAPVLLLALAAAWAPPASAGTAADPEVADPAGDQEVDAGPLPVTVPGVNDEAFADVDVVAAYVTEFGPSTRIVVQTTAAWTSGSMALTFNVTRGPTSLPSSTATGLTVTLFVNGTTVSGVANGTAATTTDGLRIDVPTAALGAVGGDLLADLAVATTRTDPGNLEELDQDDQTGTDAAGPGRAYTFARPAPAGRLRVEIVGGSQVTGEFPSGSNVRLRVANDGLDPDDVTVAVSRSDGEAAAVSLSSSLPVRVPAGEERVLNVTVMLPGKPLPAGTTDLTFTATGTLGGSASAVLRVTVPDEPVPPGDREVKPAGLTFLTGAAEGMGLDGAFGSYAEAFLLALIVLLVILAIYLLLALGRSTLAGAPAEEAPMPEPAPVPAPISRKTTPGPSGLAETVRARPAPVPEPEPELEPEPVPAAAASPSIRIEEVRHEPKEPEAGQQVLTEVILRNDGPTASLRLALSVDGKPAAERTVQVPSRATKAVELPWTAGPGDNRVRIQAFPA